MIILLVTSSLKHRETFTFLKYGMHKIVSKVVFLFRQIFKARNFGMAGYFLWIHITQPNVLSNFDSYIL